MGNPGSQYENTRHNMGFIVADALMLAWDIVGETQKFHSSYALTKRFDHDVYLLKPLTYMNHSGRAVREFMSFYKCHPHDLLLLYDDIDLDFGTARYRSEGSAGTHNGVRSIIQEVGSSIIPRLRLGIGPVQAPYSLKDFVLKSFNEDELLLLDKFKGGCVQFVEAILNLGEKTAMNQFNNKSFL